MLHLKVLKVNNISPSFKNPLKLIITINMYLQNNHNPFSKKYKTSKLCIIVNTN